MVTIEHTKKVDGKLVTYYSQYMHLSRIDVKAGDPVEEGRVIGGMGNTGNAGGTPTHLHFQIRAGNKTVNPSSQFTFWDRVKQFFRGIFSSEHSALIPETDYEKVRPKPKPKEK
jgi:murein DD-endopeptidase MepM/ murein hydrolase activator NlpD